MGQPCKDHHDPNSPDPDPALGRTYLTPAQFEKQLEMLRTGRYRLSAIAARFGQTPSSINYRIDKHPDLREKWLAAKAEGEMRLCDEMHDGTPQEAEAAQFFLERIHHMQKPIDAAKRRLYYEELLERRRGGGRNDLQQIAEVVRAIVERRPAPPEPDGDAEGDERVED